MHLLTVFLKFLFKRSTLMFMAGAWLLRNRQSRRRVLMVVVTAIVLIVLNGELWLDHRHLPWRPLDIDDRAGWATDLKLRAIHWGPESWCTSLLDESSHLTLEPVDAHDGKGQCGWSQAFQINTSGKAKLSGEGAYPMSCALAAGAHIWLSSADHHARELLGSPIERVLHYGTYSCRRINNRPTGKLSQHAFANAWDVSGFRLEDGTVISVLKDWGTQGPKRQFLRAVHNDGCRIFNITLGPDYNQAHRDHFHVDMGGGVSCR